MLFFAAQYLEVYVDEKNVVFGVLFPERKFQRCYKVCKVQRAKQPPVLFQKWKDFGFASNVTYRQSSNVDGEHTKRKCNPFAVIFV